MKFFTRYTSTSSNILLTLLVLVLHNKTYNPVQGDQKALQEFVSRGCKYTEYAQDLGKDSDFVIGALFPVHSLSGDKYKLDPQGVSWVESFLFAIDQINKNTTLLPGVKLGYDVRDTCKNAQVAIQQTLDFLTETEYYKYSYEEETGGDNSNETVVYGYSGTTSDTCKCVGQRNSRLIGVVGGATSIVSSSTSFLLATDSVPQISYSATSPSLSEKHTYPSFLRTVPSDLSQVNAISDLALHFNWTYVSVLASDDEYGRMAVVKLRNTLRQKNICFAVDRLFDPNFISSTNNDDNNNDHYFTQITDALRAVYHASKVVILWADLDTALRIINATEMAGMNDTLWVLGTETWNANKELIEKKVKSKIIKLSISQLDVQSYVSHLQGIGFQSHLNNTWIRQFWNELGYCPEYSPRPPNCFDMRPNGRFLPRERAENVISAVYALAYTLHKFMGCNTNQCNTSLTTFDYDRFLNLLKRPSNRFNVPSSSMFLEFDGNGDVTVNAYNYEIFYLPVQNKAIQFGRWYSGGDQRHHQNNQIQINKAVWNDFNPTQQKKQPIATCAFPCQPGTYKVSGLSACCWQCIPCYPDEISATVDAPKCQKCRHDEVSSSTHDRCIPLNDMRLSVGSDAGKIVIVLSALGFAAATCVLCVFVLYWDTPVVKSSSREISVIQLVCMMLLFCYPVLYFVQTTTVTCILRTVLFCSLHTLILAFILLKTYRLLRVFQPKRFTKISRFLHNKYQVMTSFLLVAMVLLVLAAWYYSHLPQVELRTVKEETASGAADQQQEHQRKGFIYHCGAHEEIVFYCVLAYVIFLSLASGFMAFKARRLPSNFKEAQYIWLAMFIACLAWFTLFPLHITQSFAKKPVVVVGVNGAVVASTLFVLYAYKVYIVLLKPQLNSSDHFSKLAANATVTTFLKDANLGSTTASSRQQHQQVVSFDFDSMFDEYKKSRSHTKSFKESFKHFPRTFRMSSKIKRASTAGGGATGNAHNNNKDNNPNTNSTLTTEKEKHRRLFKAKNKTLQQLPDHRQRRRNDEIRRHQMPPKSMSFNGGEKGRRIPLSLPLTKYQHNNKNNPPAEFFIDFEDSAAKVSIAGSRSGSNISLIKTPPTTTTKENSDNVNSTLNRTATDQSDHSTTTNQNSIRNRIYDSFKKKNRNSKNNKLTKQKSSSSVDGTIDLGNQSSQSNAAKNNTAAVDQSNGILTHVNNRSNELVKGMNLEVFDTFV